MEKNEKKQTPASLSPLLPNFQQISQPPDFAEMSTRHRTVNRLIPPDVLYFLQPQLPIFQLNPSTASGNNEARKRVS
jgi:hypothetical protein